MSGKTINYDLNLPDLDEYYDIGIHNDNYSILDEKLGENQAKLDGLAEVAVSGKYSDLEGSPDLSLVASSGVYNDLLYRPYTSVKYANALISAVNAMDDNGGVIYLLPGTYELTEDLSIGVNNVVLMGSGAGTVLKFGASSNLHIIGDNISLRNLTMTREVESGTWLVEFNRSGAHTASYAEFNNVVFDCKVANASNGLIRGAISTEGVSKVRILNCIIKSDEANAIIGNNTEHFVTTGVIDDCIANVSGMTVPETMTLGTNQNITATEATATSEEV